MSTTWDEFNEMHRRMERMMDGFTSNAKTYGFTVHVGPDGIPHMHEFGDDVPASDNIREPLTDVSVENDVVRIVVELPGVQKEDIHLDCAETSVTVSVDTESRKFRKTVPLKTNIDVDSAKAEYNNGILEVTVNSKSKAPEGKRIDIQ
jgi:Molecular chaperone (small heat shock protein)